MERSVKQGFWVPQPLREAAWGGMTTAGHFMKEKSISGASTTAQQTNPLPVVLASHMGIYCSYDYFTSNPLPCLWPETAAKDGPSPWIPALYPHGRWEISSWLLAQLWPFHLFGRVNQLLENLSVYLLLSVHLLFKVKTNA